MHVSIQSLMQAWVELGPGHPARRPGVPVRAPRAVQAELQDFDKAEARRRAKYANIMDGSKEVCACEKKREQMNKKGSKRRVRYRCVSFIGWLTCYLLPRGSPCVPPLGSSRRV